MAKAVLILFFVFLFLHGCTDSKADFDTSPFSDKEVLPNAPIWDLNDAVIVFYKKNLKLPEDLSSLKKLSRQDYIDACITDGIEDSIITDDSKLDFFSESETSFNISPSGLEIEYAYKDSSLLWFEEWHESLYSTEFDAYTPVIFSIIVEIYQGRGTIRIDLDSNETEVVTEQLSRRYGLSPTQEFHIINERVVMEHPEPVCFEEPRKK